MNLGLMFPTISIVIERPKNEGNMTRERVLISFLTIFFNKKWGNVGEFTTFAKIFNN